MASRQTWLFPPPAPLLDRLGASFFREIPTGPGVYLMCGPTEGVLYVGSARNLRRRLAAYRVANPDRLPRRTLRLLHLVTRIEWDQCDSEQSARYREELLICVLAPRFNVAGKVFERRRPATAAASSARSRQEPALGSRGSGAPGNPPASGETDTRGKVAGCVP